MACKILVRSLFHISHLEEHGGYLRITLDKNVSYSMEDFAIISGKTFGFCYQTFNYSVVCDNYEAFITCLSWNVN
jgi:hypothetical protein